MNKLLRGVVSLWIWLALAALIVAWFPLLSLIRWCDRDPVRYTTGRWFRRLGVAMTRVNPFWVIELTGTPPANPRNPFVVVSNHQSLADIPIISHVPWEMKWVAKQELFRLPFVGWMMRLAGDIPLNRRDRQSGARMLLLAEKYLAGHCSVMIFPEGTRSLDGQVGRFAEGAFQLAARAGVPVLPLAVEGSLHCLPKHSWLFGRAQTIRVKILSPIHPDAAGPNAAATLHMLTRQAILAQIASWRGCTPADIDRLTPSPLPSNQ